MAGTLHPAIYASTSSAVSSSGRGLPTSAWSTPMTYRPQMGSNMWWSPAGGHGIEGGAPLAITSLRSPPQLTLTGN
jgi:hypothetical protein